MAVKGTLILLRHGQTTYNAEQRMAGHADVPLTPEGEQQARDAGKIIGPYRFDAAYASTLSRAFNTAALALDAAGTNSHLKNADGSWNISRHKEIMECDAGDFTGLMLNDPKVLAFERKHGAPLPNGESDVQFIARVKDFYDTEVKPRIDRGETVLVVSHAGVMHAFDAILGLEVLGPEGLWATKRRLPNTAALKIDFEDGKMVADSFIGCPPANANTPPKPGHIKSW
jgi:2,3-bisphosphoglycerate-dependent phosphoglycerate mutase